MLTLLVERSNWCGAAVLAAAAVVEVVKEGRAADGGTGAESRVGCSSDRTLLPLLLPLLLMVRLAADAPASLCVPDSS